MLIALAELIDLADRSPVEKCQLCLHRQIWARIPDFRPIRKRRNPSDYPPAILESDSSGVLFRTPGLICLVFAVAGTAGFRPLDSFSRAQMSAVGILFRKVI
jgi:hypothetical protein